MTQGAIEWIEIPAADTQASINFYRTVFGWEMQSFDPDYPMFKDPTGHVGGGFIRKAAPTREAGIMLYISVESIDTIIGDITRNGGKMAHPKTEIAPEIGSWASFNDPAGNLIGLYQRPLK